MDRAMQKKVFQLLVDNTSGVLSRISGLFSRRGYNIESITAGVTADPRFTRITIVTSGDDEILDQIEAGGCAGYQGTEAGKQRIQGACHDQGKGGGK